MRSSFPCFLSSITEKELASRAKKATMTMTAWPGGSTGEMSLATDSFRSIAMRATRVRALTSAAITSSLLKPYVCLNVGGFLPAILAIRAMSTAKKSDML